MMINDVAVRKCGASFAYCNGNCSDCEANTAYATTSTEAVSRQSISAVEVPVEEELFGKPSKEEYEKAKKDREYIGTCLNLCRKRRNELIDELCKERESEKFYIELYEKHRDIIRRYEIYEEIENNV